MAASATVSIVVGMIGTGAGLGSNESAMVRLQINVLPTSG